MNPEVKELFVELKKPQERGNLFTYADKFEAKRENKMATGIGRIKLPPLLKSDIRD